MHTHTVRSDGNDTPQELLDNATKAGLKVVAITDHDTPPPLDIFEYADSLGIKYIPGYEFSCDTNVDDVHICGYGLDWEHPALAEEVIAARESKSNAYHELCELLTSKGIIVDWVHDILNERTPDEVERKHIFEAIAANGYTSTWSEAKIMVRDDPELNIKRRKIDSVAAVKLIHECGGIAILAHPYLIDETVAGGISRAEYIEMLVAAGLDGIEASYTYGKTSYKGELGPEEIEREIRELYADRLIISGGSDYHAGHKKGNAKVRNLGERGISMEEFKKFKI
jgi:predicted metal-dependent phosphoesterase TrpH